MNAGGLRHDEACGGNAQDCPRPISDCFRMGQVRLVLHTLSVTGCPEDVPTPESPQDGTRSSRVARTLGYACPRWAQDGPRWLHGGPWVAQLRFVVRADQACPGQLAQGGLKMAQDGTGACPLARAVCHACPGRFQDCLRRAEHTPQIGQDAFRFNLIIATSFAQFLGISSAVCAVPVGANISDLLIRGCRVARVGSAEHGAVRQWLSYVLRRVRPAWH